MQRLVFLLILLTFLFTPTIFGQTQQLDPPTQEEMNKLLTQLSEIKDKNPQLGPNYDLVREGDSLYFADGSAVSIPAGSYISRELLKQMRGSGYETPTRIVVQQESRVKMDSTNLQQADLPSWLFAWLVVLTILVLPIFFILLGRLMPDPHEEDGPLNTEPVEDNHPTLSHDPFRQGGYDPEHADADLHRLAEEHTGFEDPNIDERTRGVLQTEGPVVLHRYDRFGNSIGSDELAAGAELTVIRATARDGHEDVEYIFAAVRCMNRILVPEGEFEFIPEEELDEEIQL